MSGPGTVRITSVKEYAEQTFLATLSGGVAGFLGGHAINLICKKKICNPLLVGSGLGILNFNHSVLFRILDITLNRFKINNSTTKLYCSTLPRVVNYTLTGLAILRLDKIHNEKAFFSALCGLSALGMVVLKRV